MCVELETKVTPWILPLLFPSTSTILFGVMIILFFCDAPYTDDNEVYIITRVNRVKWILSMILYTFLVSVIILLLLFLISLAVVFPHFAISLEWGDILRMLQDPETAFPYGVYISGTDPIIMDYEPLQAFAYSGGFFILASTIIGSIMFTVNLYANRIVGASVCMFIVLLDSFANSQGSAVLHFSPMSWANIMSLDYMYETANPSASLALAIAIIAITACWIISYVKFRDSDINTLETI